LLAPSGEANMAALEGTLHAEGRCLYIAGNDTAKSRTFPAFSIAGDVKAPALGVQGTLESRHVRFAARREQSQAHAAALASPVRRRRPLGLRRH
jgi:hypothetical protein